MDTNEENRPVAIGPAVMLNGHLKKNRGAAVLGPGSGYVRSATSFAITVQVGYGDEQ